MWGPINNGELPANYFKKKSRTERICSKFSSSVNFNIIPRKLNTEIPIKSYKDQCREHMIKNGMGDVFSLPDPRNQDNSYNIFINKYIFTLYCMKIYFKGLKWGSKAEQYMFQNLAWSVVYLRSTLACAMLQTLLNFFPLTSTRSEVYVVTMATVHSDS